MSVDQISFITNLVREALSSGAESIKELDLKQRNAEGAVVIKPPSFTVDASWLSADVGKAKNKKALEDLISQIESTGIDRNYSKENFISAIDALQSAMIVKKGEDMPIGQMLSRINIIRVLHNLAATEAGRQSAAGFGFENFLAIFFKDGEALTPAANNIADVTLGVGQQASIKFLSGQYPTVTGSVKSLLETIGMYGHIDYIIGIKKKGQIDFLYARITAEELLRVSGKSGKVVRRWMNFLSKKSSVEPKTTQFGFSLKQLKFKKITTLNTSGALEVAQFLLDGLNSQFNDLLTNLQQLAEKVNEVTYAGDSERKSKAGQAAQSAELTKQSAEEIQ